MDLLLIIIIVVGAAVVLCRPKAPPEPVVIYIERAPENAERAGGCLPLLLAAFAIGVLIRLLGL